MASVGPTDDIAAGPRVYFREAPSPSPCRAAEVAAEVIARPGKTLGRAAQQTIPSRQGSCHGAVTCMVTCSITRPVGVSDRPARRVPAAPADRYPKPAARARTDMDLGYVGGRLDLAKISDPAKFRRCDAVERCDPDRGRGFSGVGRSRKWNGLAALDVPHPVPDAAPVDLRPEVGQR